MICIKLIVLVISLSLINSFVIKYKTSYKLIQLYSTNIEENKTQPLSINENPYELTPLLKQYSDSFRNVVDDKLRYQQLLYLAAKSNPMNDALKIQDNKVPGCLSTVYVHATMDPDGKVFYSGDSDSQLTKGLVTMLVNGLSGHAPTEILKVNPEFIKYAGVAKSLTPGRNNGFLNMLGLMKNKAKAFITIDNITIQNNDKSNEIDERKGGPIYHSMYKKLSLLKPTELIILDDSYKHAGHSGINELQGTETHFTVSIIASCFEGLSRVQRHQMIYTLLTQEMNNGIHALSITAKTPME